MSAKDNSPDSPEGRIASRYVDASRQPQIRTAGEVRFIKDRGNDEKQWGWGTPGPSNREITEDFEFDAKNLKPLAKVLKATLASMGHALVAYDGFTRVKSATVSPDGNLGGKGYIQKIPDMRRAYMNVVEALSALSDTLHDEMAAPHWNPAIQEQSNRERDEVKQIMTDADDIRDNPEAWAMQEEGEDGAEFPPKKKPPFGQPPAGGGDAGGEGGGGDEGDAGSAGVSKLALSKTAGSVFELTAAARVAARHMARRAQ
jgi:hypothetical protein